MATRVWSWSVSLATSSVTRSPAPTTRLPSSAATPVFKWLYAEKPFAGFGEGQTAEFMDQMLARSNPDYASNPDIKWNFTKFLVDRKGKVVARYEPTVAPEQLEKEIEALL